MSNHEKINYLEFPSKDIGVTKSFFTAVFDWTFVDYGPDYVSASGVGIDVGFFKADLVVSTETGSVLVVFFSRDLEATQEKVHAAGGTTIKPVFDFPGGRRFHFTDPNGNEYAVWSDS